jgi:hypothetical protein
MAAGHRWFMLVILASQETEIRRIEVQSQPRKILCETLSQKNPSQKRAGGMAQGVGPEFKSQYHTHTHTHTHTHKVKWCHH